VVGEDPNEVQSVAKALIGEVFKKTPGATPTKAPVVSAGRVFISYRRDQGSEMARLIRVALESRGWDVFLDVDDLRSSPFDERLLLEIDNADGFVVILSPEALNRCSQTDDYFRQEIAHALARKKRIVPVLKAGFSFPDKDKLPAAILELQRHNGVPYSHEFFPATIDKIVCFLSDSGPEQSLQHSDHMNNVPQGSGSPPV
jgi:hypothetical protein